MQKYFLIYAQTYFFFNDLKQLTEFKMLFKGENWIQNKLRTREY